MCSVVRDDPIHFTHVHPWLFLSDARGKKVLNTLKALNKLNKIKLRRSALKALLFDWHQSVSSDSSDTWIQWHTVRP
jgi:hypothetical protein